MIVFTPHVELVAPKDKWESLRLIYGGYRRCYSPENAAEYDTPDNMDKFIRRMMASGHESPLEHASFQFHIACSRACSHQLVRHRLASFSQQSQRYVKADFLEAVQPESVRNDPEMAILYRNFLLEAEMVYRHLTDRGVPAEDARYVVPNAAKTMLVMTMNCRELLHFFRERLCARAQWEIRDIASQMLKILKNKLPCVFENAGPKCVRLGFCPERKSCGRTPNKEAGNG